MPASDHNPVKPSHPAQPVARAHTAQVPPHLVAAKTNGATGRAPVNQSPLPKRSTT